VGLFFAGVALVDAIAEIFDDAHAADLHGGRQFALFDGKVEGVKLAAGPLRDRIEQALAMLGGCTYCIGIE
jgi:hypothetical protein